MGIYFNNLKLSMCKISANVLYRQSGLMFILFSKTMINFTVFKITKKMFDPFV